MDEVWAGLYKQRVSRHALAVGIERKTTRLEFEAQQRNADLIAPRQDRVA